MDPDGSTFELMYRNQDPPKIILAQMLLRRKLQSVRIVIDEVELNRGRKVDN